MLARGFAVAQVHGACSGDLALLGAPADPDFSSPGRRIRGFGRPHLCRHCGTRAAHGARDAGHETAQPIGQPTTSWTCTVGWALVPRQVTGAAAEWRC